MALCDAETTHEAKRQIVQALLSQDRPQQFEPAPPEHKTQLLNGQDVCTPQLHHFVGPRSWMLFDIFDVDVHFLAQDPETWPGHDSYGRFHNILHKIVCVNDCAERAVKDTVDYINYSHNPDRCNDIVLVVNSHRELIDFRNLTKEECAKLT